MIFCRHYISPLNTFMQGRIRSRIREAQKHADPADPDPQHWFQHRLDWLYLVPKGWFYPLNNMTCCCSIFLSVMLAQERHLRVYAQSSFLAQKSNQNKEQENQGRGRKPTKCVTVHS